MDKDIKNKITLDMMKKMNELSNREKRVYENPIIDEDDDEHKKINEEQIQQIPKEKAKKEMSILRMIGIHLLIVFVVIIVSLIFEMI